MQNEVATKVERFARYLRRAGIHVGREIGRGRPPPAIASAGPPLHTLNISF